ncbi:hypothetical protein CCDC5079_2889 [Mycobacterium tuberculosis CCDC5079]|nr:hypothetical protein CCDC5079_2889 [Mycobacterium tuberculosis CCDC5079]
MSDPRPARAVVVGIDGSRAATHAALWAVDEAVNRDIPLRLVYVIDPSQLSAAGEGGGQSAARAALHDASRKVEATGQPVKIETEVLCGRPLTKLMQESRSAAMLCVGSVGLDHVRGRRGSVAATLAGSALCPRGGDSPVAGRASDNLPGQRGCRGGGQWCGAAARIRGGEAARSSAAGRGCPRC